MSTTILALAIIGYVTLLNYNLRKDLADLTSILKACHDSRTNTEPNKHRPRTNTGA